MARQHGVISDHQAEEVGWSRSTRQRRRDSGLLTTVHPGVHRSANQPDTWHSRLVAACLSTGGVASHRSAAILWRFDSVRGWIIEVTVAKSSTSPRAGVVVHESVQMHLADQRTIDGIPVTGPARTLLDLGAVVPPGVLEDAVDDALRLRLVTWHDLRDTLVEHAAKGRRGCGPMRRLLEERDGDDQIPLSTWSRHVQRLLVANGIRPPVLEHRIVDPHAGLVAQVDLAYPAERIALELQSKRWHLNETSFDADPERWNSLTGRGWRVYPITWTFYKSKPRELCRMVADALAGTPAHSAGASMASGPPFLATAERPARADPERAAAPEWPGPMLRSDPAAARFLP